MLPVSGCGGLAPATLLPPPPLTVPQSISLISVPVVGWIMPPSQDVPNPWNQWMCYLISQIRALLFIMDFLAVILIFLKYCIKMLFTIKGNNSMINSEFWSFLQLCALGKHLTCLSLVLTLQRLTELITLFFNLAISRSVYSLDCDPLKSLDHRRFTSVCLASSKGSRMEEVPSKFYMRGIIWVFIYSIFYNNLYGKRI